jgi:hypothetical protein
MAIALCACGSGGSSSPAPSAPATLRLSSPAFAAGGTIPARFTCDGANESPPLAFGGVPAGARQLALSMDDPDAPGGDFTHWLLYRVPPRTRALAAGAVPPGAAQGRNSFGRSGYSGPCPPKGDRPHRYRLVLYALRRPLALAPGASPDAFRAAVSGAALAEGTLRGTYSR